MILVLASACWTTFPIASPLKSSFKKPQNALPPVLSIVDLQRAASYISNEVRNTIKANSVFTVKQLSCTLVFPVFEIPSCYSGKNCNNELDKGSKDCTSKITKCLGFCFCFLLCSPLLRYKVKFMPSSVFKTLVSFIFAKKHYIKNQYTLITADFEYLDIVTVDSVITWTSVECSILPIRLSDQEAVHFRSMSFKDSHTLPALESKV